MSNTPFDSFENSSARASRPNMPSLTVTGPSAAPALTSDSSESALCGLIVASMRCISAITAAIATSASARLAAYNSTSMAVPMMASSRRYQPAPAGADPWAGRGDGGATVVMGKGRLVMISTLEPGGSRDPAEDGKIVVLRTAGAVQEELRSGHADCTFPCFGRIFAVKSIDQV